MKKRIISAISALMIFTNTAYASILGSDILSWSHEIATGSELYKNEFMSEQNGVGRQTEYYAKYTPNTSVLPKVITGKSIWGLRNITKAEEYMKDNGMVPLMGINASFFSFQTGVPMGLVISNGNIISKDTENYQTIGFNKDGTAFISPLKIKTVLKFDKTQAVQNVIPAEDGEGTVLENVNYETIYETVHNELEISHINKYNQETTPIINLYTDDFDANNHNEVKSLSIILGEIEGNLKIGETLAAKVEDKFIYKGAIAIPENKYVLTLNENSDTELYNKLNSLEVGDSVEISSFDELGNDKWLLVDSAMGSVGDRLLKNGLIGDDFEKGAAPRTAVGITRSGEVIFYVIDGRQTGYSYGVQIKTLANRLKELGCVDAINLDGGGSTAISGIYPGSEQNVILNSPSGGTLRACSNYLFLTNAKEPTGVLGAFFSYPFEQHYLSGYTEQIYTNAVDTEYYSMNKPDGIEYSISEGSSTLNTETNSITFNGTETVTFKAKYQDVVGEDIYYSYDEPTNIIVKDSSGKEVSELNLKHNDKLSFTFDAYYNNIKLKANQESFKLSLSDTIGSVDNNSIYITCTGADDVLKVTAGKTVKEIPLHIEYEYPFIDIKGHWARDKIKYIFEQNIVSGYESTNGFEFLPNKQITREEFAVMMCKFLNSNISTDLQNEMTFDDKDKISSWATPYVSILVNKEIMLGKDTGQTVIFAPQDNLTRAEAITILSRILSLESNSQLEFTDINEIPSWANEAISKMVSNGLISGYEDNTIKPNKQVTRAEAVTMIYNILLKEF